MSPDHDDAHSRCPCGSGLEPVDMAAAVQEDKGTLEDVHEPYLIQAGFLERTGRGRQATKLAFDHFKRPTSLLFS